LTLSGTLPVRGFSISLSILQFVLVVSMAAYLTTMRVALDRRNRRSWEQVVARHQPGASKRAVFHNAGVLLEMVDYSCNAQRPVDASLAEALRREAMRVRMETVLSPIHWA
jgi:hypothetical protein